MTPSSKLVAPCSSCNSSTHWQVPDLVTSLRPLLLSRSGPFMSIGPDH
jgi:hypothetical protein